MFKKLILTGLFLSLTSLTFAQDKKMDKKLEKATFGAGCFWCVEAVFELVKGVEHVESGYSGGNVENPSYKEVTSGRSGHVEVARIHFDPSAISYEQLLEVLWHSHDPTTLNQQGADKGTQYRSAIFYHNEEQKKIGAASLKKTDKSGLWKDPIVTTIEPLTNYYVAENYHQNYFENNPNAGYCSYVIAPKIKKFKKEFKHLLKSSSSD